MESVAEEYDEREALALLVGSLGRLGRVDSGELVQHPVAGSIEALQMLLGTAGHFFGRISLQNPKIEKLIISETSNHNPNTSVCPLSLV